MQLKTLGPTGMALSRVGLGAWAIGGGGWEYGWGPQDDADSVATIRRAVERGVNWIDTAAVYGLGHAEEVVARALEGVRDRPFVFTKCGRPWDESGAVGYDISPEGVRRECEASLRRLKVDVIDLYQVHWPVPDEDVERAWETMLALQKEGKARHVGVSNFSAEQLERVRGLGPVASNQPPYSLADRGVEAEVLPYCREHGIGVINYSPMASGLLSGGMTRERFEALPADDWRRRGKHFQEPALSRNLKLVRVLKGIGERHGTTPAAVAVAWTLQHPAVTAAIVGARRPEQVDGFLAAGDLLLDEADDAQLEAFLRENTLPASQR